MHNLTEHNGVAYSKTYQVDQYHPEGPDTQLGAISISTVVPRKGISDTVA